MAQRPARINLLSDASFALKLTEHRFAEMFHANAIATVVDPT